MSVSIRAVRAAYRFAEAAPVNLSASFRASAVEVRKAPSGTDAVSVTLSGRRNALKGGPLDAAEAADGSTDASKPQSGLRSIFGTVKSIGDSINRIQKELKEVATGSEREKALQEELTQQQQQYQQILDDPNLKRLREIFSHIDGVLGQGLSPSSLARLLQGEAGLLGQDFLGVLQKGDLAGLSQIKAGVDQLFRIDPTSDTAGDQLKQVGNSVLKALSGSEYHEERTAPVVVSDEKEKITGPNIQKTKIDLPGGLSFALNTVAVKDVAKAIEAHSLPDPRFALTLILDDGKPDPTEAEKRRAQKKKQEDEELSKTKFDKPNLETSAGGKASGNEAKASASESSQDAESESDQNR